MVAYLTFIFYHHLTFINQVNNSYFLNIYVHHSILRKFLVFASHMVSFLLIRDEIKILILIKRKKLFNLQYIRNFHNLRKI